MNSAFEKIKKLQEFLDERTYLLQGSSKQPLWRRSAHFWLLVFKSFQRNRGPVRAASLAYTTILSLVPILAVVVSISTGFLQNDQGNTVRNLLDKMVAYVAPQLDLIQGDEDEDAMNRQEVVEKIQSYINAVNSGTLGITAGLLLIFIAVTVLSSVEATFNDIWGVRQGRTWSARIVQYWAAITLGPLFIVTALALTSVGSVKDDKAAKGDAAVPVSTNSLISELTNNPPDAITARRLAGVNSLQQADPDLQGPPIELAETPLPPGPREPGFLEKIRAIFADSKLAPFVSFIILSIFLTLFYRLMPATKVQWHAAAVGGVVGGGLLQLNNILSVIYLSRVVTYSKIYGSLGAVPVFLLGLYFSWIIVLLGAQVAYAYQNRQAYLQEKQTEAINQRGREFVALRLMAYIAQRFYLGEKPATRLEMSNALAIPSQVASQALNSLVGGKLLVEVLGEETGFAPGRPINKITVEDVLCALRVGNGTELETSEDPSRAIVKEEYDRVILAEMHAAGAVTLQDLVIRMAALPPEKLEPIPAAVEPAAALA